MENKQNYNEKLNSDIVYPTIENINEYNPYMNEPPKTTTAPIYNTNPYDQPTGSAPMMTTSYEPIRNNTTPVYNNQFNQNNVIPPTNLTIQTNTAPTNYQRHQTPPTIPITNTYHNVSHNAIPQATTHLIQTSTSPIVAPMNNNVVIPVPQSNTYVISSTDDYSNLVNFRPVEPYGMNIPYFTHERLAQMEEIKVLPKQPIERISLRDFKMVQCPNITTYWIQNMCFSHLTNPQNIEGKFYYLLKDQEGIFVPAFNSVNGVPYTRVTSPMLNDFTNQINIANNSNLEEKNVTSSIKRRKTINLICGILALILCILIFYGLTTATFRYNSTMWSFILVLNLVACILNFCSLCVNRKEIYNKTLCSLQKNRYLEDVVNKWNTDFFIPNGLYATVPRNNNYVQLGLVGHRLTLIHHTFPFDMIRSG